MSNNVESNEGCGVGWKGIIQNLQSSVTKNIEDARIAKEAKAVGKIWDKRKKQWIFYFINQELEEIIQEEKLLKQKNQDSSLENPDSHETEQPVQDCEYYNLLGVLTNATTADTEILLFLVEIVGSYNYYLGNNLC